MADAIAFHLVGNVGCRLPESRLVTTRGRSSRATTAFACDRPPDGCGRTSSIAWPSDPDAELREVSGLPSGQQSTTVPGSPQESLPDTSGDTGLDDPIPQDDPKDDQ
jgi:hypothetical protein